MVFVVDLPCECSGIEPACEGVCHCQPFASIRIAGRHHGKPERHVRCWQSSAQSISDARKGHCLFLSEFDQDSRVLLEPEQQKCWDLATIRFVREAGYAVRLGVRGAKWCAGQLGGRARVQRGGDLSRHLPPRRRLHARYYQKRVFARSA